MVRACVTVKRPRDSEKSKRRFSSRLCIPNTRVDALRLFAFLKGSHGL